MDGLGNISPAFGTQNKKTLFSDQMKLPMSIISQS
jgi:hypothetical protein